MNALFLSFKILSTDCKVLFSFLKIHTVIHGHGFIAVVLIFLGSEGSSYPFCDPGPWRELTSFCLSWALVPLDLMKGFLALQLPPIHDMSSYSPQALYIFLNPRHAQERKIFLSLYLECPFHPFTEIFWLSWLQDPFRNTELKDSLPPCLTEQHLSALIFQPFLPSMFQILDREQEG